MGERDRLWCEDDAYLLELVAGALYGATPSPADVTAAGRAAYTWLTVEAELDRCLHPTWPERRPTTRLGFAG
jgi:hypothetical protein